MVSVYNASIARRTYTVCDNTGLDAPIINFAVYETAILYTNQFPVNVVTATKQLQTALTCAD